MGFLQLTEKGESMLSNQIVEQEVKNWITTISTSRRALQRNKLCPLRGRLSIQRSSCSGRQLGHSGDIIATSRTVVWVLLSASRRKNRTTSNLFCDAASVLHLTNSDLILIPFLPLKKTTKTPI